MSDKQIRKSASPAYKIYELTVHGALKEDWRDWFNGMLIATQGHSARGVTAITCRVRDQAELIGIINWLHNNNMVIESVRVIPSGLREC